MAFTTANPVPIVCVGNKEANNPAPVTNGNIGEAATQTFKTGTPLAMSSGNYAAWGGSAPTALPVILGISLQAGQNLATANTPVPNNYGSVPNQSSAVNVFGTGPVVLGGQPFAQAGAGNVFAALFGATGANYTPTTANIGVRYGLTKDSSTGFWYIDTDKTAANDVAVLITGIDPVTSSNLSNITSASRGLFTFLATVVQQ